MNIAVLTLPAIGDALMAMPMIKILRKHYPNANIDVITMFAGVSYVYSHNPLINSVKTLSLYKENSFKGVMQTLALRKKQYDVSLLAFPSYRREYHIVSWLVGAKKRIAHQFKTGYVPECNFLDTDHILVDESVHNIINNLNLLHALNIQWEKEITEDNLRYEVMLDKKDIEFGKTFIRNLGWERKDIIGIHPGSTHSAAALLRRWPIERYAEVVSWLIDKKKKVLIFVGPDERELGERLEKLVNDKKDSILVKEPFGKTLGILSQVNFLLCNDNGFGHLAVALNKPIVTLWASTNDRWSLPYNTPLVTLIRPKHFEPWYRYELKRGIPKGKTSGMELISVQDVIKVIKRKL